MGAPGQEDAWRFGKVRRLRGLAPFVPGFRTMPYSNADALEAAIDEHAAVFFARARSRGGQLGSGGDRVRVAGRRLVYVGSV